MDQADRILRDSQDVSFEAHFLAEMANRFDGSTQLTLSPAARIQLLELRRKHSTQIARGLVELGRELGEEHTGFHPSPADLPSAGQIPRMAQSATAVDRLITMLHSLSKLSDARQAETYGVSARNRIRHLAEARHGISPMASSGSFHGTQ